MDRKALKELKKQDRLTRDIERLEEIEYGLKEFLHGLILGIILGFILAIILMR